MSVSNNTTTVGFVVIDSNGYKTRTVKQSALFNNPNRGIKSDPKWKHILKKVLPDSKKADALICMEVQTFNISKGSKVLPCEFSIDRTVANSGDSTGGWMIYGFARMCLTFEGKTFKKWVMIHSAYADKANITFSWANDTQSALCARKTKVEHHKHVLIAPNANGSPGMELIPRREHLISNPLLKTTFLSESKLKSLGQHRVKIGERIFTKISNPDYLVDISSGGISDLMVPGFNNPVFNVRNTTTFREEKDDKKIFSMSPGRWMLSLEITPSGVENIDLSNIEIYDISFGAAHRASVSVASLPKVKEGKKKRSQNKNVFRRL